MKLIEFDLQSCTAVDAGIVNSQIASLPYFMGVDSEFPLVLEGYATE